MSVAQIRKVTLWSKTKTILLIALTLLLGRGVLHARQLAKQQTPTLMVDVGV
jgi:hypothetical protein